MIVGNDAELTALTGKILERKGYDVICCADIGELPILLDRENIRLVIADVETDESARLHFCREVKSMSKSPQLLLSAEAARRKFQY